MTSRPPATNAHPFYAVGRRYSVNSAGFAVVGVAGLAISPLAGAICLVLAGWNGWLAWEVQKRLPGAMLVNRAYERITAGDLQGAKELLDAVDAKSINNATARALRTHRGTLALLEGDARSAASHATAALRGRVSIFAREHEMAQIANALSLRALANAVSGERDAALADGKAVRAHEGAVAGALARASLADAVVLAATERRDLLRDLFARDGRLMRNHLLARERVLARALARLAKAEKRSVYREPAKRSDSVDPIADWVHRVAPLDCVRAEPPPTSPPSPAAMTAVLATRKAPPAFRTRIGLWALGFSPAILAIAIWLLQPTAHTPSSSSPDFIGDALASTLTSLSVFGVVLVGGMTAWGVWRNRRLSARLRQAGVAEARGDRPTAIAMYLSLAQGRPPFVHADLELATLAEREGRFQDALAFCERGLGRLSTQAAKAIAHDVLLPALAAERAFCLSALGRFDEANAELATLANHPTYPFAAMGHLRVRLVQALVAGDRQAALAVARTRNPNLPMPARDEILSDLLEATEGDGVGQEEWARIDAELSEDPELAACAEHFMPGVRARLVPTRVGSGPAEGALGVGEHHLEAVGVERLEEEVDQEARQERQQGSAKTLSNSQ